MSKYLGDNMKIGDLVIGNGLVYRDYGVGIIIGKEFGRMKVYWPEQGFWSYTGLKGIELL
jgi:hypothetical protein